MHKLDENAKRFILLEIGNIQHLIQVYNFTHNEYWNISGCSFKLINSYKDNKHYFEDPISIRGVGVRSTWEYKKGMTPRFEGTYDEVVTSIFEDTEIKLPILANTKLTAFIDPQETWMEIQNYISSLNNDVDVSIPMTEKEKAETHGFDKYSFRHPIK